ncbi:hypothetical protein FDP41_000622 [Naegleria fowleri]|uniref:Importin-9 central HEAT repeats domain-containing protein n=2 Tax=Naegleria fowleri TaxID=5763 RepID=A0A6A5C2S2_NAEFO|nr:uncharacterized protein FDP41_000622 [Naegleria fowleri]KAF0984723.1 hypothetical protein FDP41_000622 [Naegleria fowleri]
MLSGSSIGSPSLHGQPSSSMQGAVVPSSLEELQREFSTLVQCLFKLGGGVGSSPQQVREAESELISFPGRCPYYGVLLLHVSLYAYLPFRNNFCINQGDNFINISIHFPLYQLIEQEQQLKSVIISPAIRQLAAVLLKGYIKSHWNNIQSPQLKKQFKDALPLGLMASDLEVEVPPSFLSKINTAFGMSIAEVAEHEFPEEWGDLIQILINIYESGLVNHHHYAQSLGSLKCLSLVAQHFSDKHTVFVFPVLVPYMLNVASNTQLPDLIRAKALTVCSEMFYLIAMVAGDPSDEADDEFEYVNDGDHESEDVNEDDNTQDDSKIDEKLIEESKKMLSSVIGQTLNLILGEISNPITNVNSDCSFKMECVKTMNILVKEFGKSLQDAVIHVLQSTCTSLSSEYEIYFKHAILSPNESGIATSQIAERFDTEGESINFTTVICQQIELLATIVCSRQLSKILSSNKNNLAQLTYLLLGYCQLPQHLMELWEDNPEQFVSEEDNQFSSYSIRTSCLKLLEDFNETYDTLGIESLLDAYNKRMQESQSLYIQNPNSSTWWKLREASLMTISSFTEFRDHIEDNPKVFDLVSLISQLLDNDLNVSSEHLPFLKSRAIQCSSYFLNQISNPKLFTVNLDMIKQLFITYVNHMAENQPIPIRLYSCQATARVFCLEKPLLDSLLSSFGASRDELLHGILASMCKLVNDIGEEPMYIPLESIAVFVNFLPQVVIPHSETVISIMLTQLSKFSNDRTIASDIINVFDKLAEIPETEAQLVNNVIPKISQIFISSATATAPDFIENLLDLSHTIIVHAKKEDMLTVLNTLYPSLMNLGFSNEEPSWIQKITECLRSIVHVGEEMIVQHRFISQQHQVSSFQFLLEYIARLLQPNFSDSAAFGVGELVTEIFAKLSTALNIDIIGQIIKACVLKLSISNDLLFIQSIVFIFAKLFHHQDVVKMFSLLESISNLKDYANGLTCVLSKWAHNQQFFFGLYKLKVTSTALAKVLQTGDPRLASVNVLMEVKEPTTGYRTRSKKIKERQVPFVLYAFMLLIDAYIRALEAKEEEKNEATLEGMMYGGGGFDDEDPFVPQDEYLNQLAQGGGDFSDDEGDEDPLSSKDPINSIDIETTLPEVMKELCSVNQQVLPHLEKILTDKQKQALQQMLQ